MQILAHNFTLIRQSIPKQTTFMSTSTLAHNFNPF